MPFAKSWTGLDLDLEQVGEILCGLDRAWKVARIDHIDPFRGESLCGPPGLLFTQCRKWRRPVAAKTPLRITGGLAVSDEVEFGRRRHFRSVPALAGLYITDKPTKLGTQNQTLY